MDRHAKVIEKESPSETPCMLMREFLYLRGWHLYVGSALRAAANHSIVKKFAGVRYSSRAKYARACIESLERPRHKYL